MRSKVLVPGATRSSARGLGRPIGVLANIETPRGVRCAAEIAMAEQRVIGLQAGGDGDPGL